MLTILVGRVLLTAIPSQQFATVLLDGCYGVPDDSNGVSRSFKNARLETMVFLGNFI